MMFLGPTVVDRRFRREQGVQPLEKAKNDGAFRSFQNSKEQNRTAGIDLFSRSIPGKKPAEIVFYPTPLE